MFHFCVIVMISYYGPVPEICTDIEVNKTSYSTAMRECESMLSKKIDEQMRRDILQATGNCHKGAWGEQA
jgi:hypothetical protein